MVQNKMPPLNGPSMKFSTVRGRDEQLGCPLWSSGLNLSNRIWLRFLLVYLRLVLLLVVWARVEDISAAIQTVSRAPTGLWWYYVLLVPGRPFLPCSSSCLFLFTTCTLWVAGEVTVQETISARVAQSATLHWNSGVILVFGVALQVLPGRHWAQMAAGKNKPGESCSSLLNGLLTVALCVLGRH